MESLRIGNGAGFLGDWLDAPRRLVEGAELDFLTLEYLAELTLSILAGQRAKDPQRGYAADFLEVLASLIPALRRQDRLRLVTNAGGVHPLACAQAASEVLDAAGLGATAVGVVRGDDLLQRLSELQAAGCDLRNLETGQPLAELRWPVVSAHAYLGAQPIARAISDGARLVITGRVADASLTVGPATHHFGWTWDDWTRLAGASVAGHLIECGAQVTGGLFRHWQPLDLARVGYPIAEVAADGSATITKPQATTGAVTRQTVVEQLVYEIDDPAHYLTPDVDVDFTTVEVRAAGTDRVLVRGAVGRPAPETLKVSLAYQDGYMASGQLLVHGNDCLSKARECARIVFRRLRDAGVEFDEEHVECLGDGHSAGSVAAEPRDLREVILRLAVRDARREAVERFSKQIAPLVTSGPPGLAGYASGRPVVRPVLAYWPTLVPRSLVEPIVEVRAAADWSRLK